jgi:hypothetical protein
MASYGSGIPNHGKRKIASMWSDDEEDFHEAFLEEEDKEEGNKLDDGSD